MSLIEFMALWFSLWALIAGTAIAVDISSEAKVKERVDA